MVVLAVRPQVAEAVIRPLRFRSGQKVVSLIAAEISHLIACCASFEAEPRAASSPAVSSSQAAIAGMLHPSAVMVAQGDSNYALRAS